MLRASSNNPSTAVFDDVAAVDFGNNIRDRVPEVRVGGFPGPFSNEPRVPLPPLPVWDGTDLNYSPDLLFNWWRCVATTLNASPQGFLHALLGALSPPWQRQVCDIEVQLRMTGQVLTWQHVKTEFLKQLDTLSSSLRMLH
jgi:hypothetical protein